MLHVELLMNFQLTIACALQVLFRIIQGRARVGITAPSEYLREDAALELAHSILADVDSEPAAHTADQLQLARIIHERSYLALANVA